MLKPFMQAYNFLLKIDICIQPVELQYFWKYSSGQINALDSKVLDPNS
jgi:hypothetical protein